MSRLKNIAIVAARFCWNNSLGKLGMALRFELDVARILEKTFPPGAPFRFVQVGAHDGISHDFLYSFVKLRDSSGLVIEPLPDLFQRLQSNYANNGKIIPVQKAVHASRDTVVLYRVDPEREHLLPGWAGGIASVDSRHHERAGIPEAYMVKVEVPAARLSSILQQHNIIGTDYLQIDAEGYDLEILKMADLNRMEPRIVRLEIASLSEEGKKEAWQLLQSAGYFCFLQTPDLVGIKLHKIIL